MLRSLKFTALVMGMIGAAHAMAAGPDLTVVSFGGANKAAQVKAFYAPWEAAGNGKIVAGEYNGEMAKVKAMVDTKSVSWDLVEVESPELSRGCDEDMFEQLDPALFGKTDFFVKQPIAELDPALAVGDVVPLGWQVEPVSYTHLTLPTKA